MRAKEQAAVRWVELTPDYRCNSRCVGCFAVDEHGPSMSSAEVVRALREGRATGAHQLWLGGGEPSLRRDLFPLLREARSLGYDRIKLQTNAMMLSYPEFTRRAKEAGLTEVALALKGACAETHDRLTRTPGSFELLLRGAENARAEGLALEADVLVYASNAHELPALVRRFHALGVRRFRFWLLSASVAVAEDAEATADMPRIADVVPQLAAAAALGLSDDPEFLVSLHTPPCTLPARIRQLRFDARAFGLLVINPGGHRFRLEESPMEGGLYLPSCARCSFRERCNGLRADYVARYGEREFEPVED